MAATLDLVRDLLDGRTSRSDEKEILSLLRSASAQELNDVLENIDTAQLFDDVDNRLIGPDNKDALIDLLARERRDDLSVEAQAAVIKGLQVGRTPKAMEEAIRDILLSRTGEELTRLKNTINLAKGRHDLEGLLYNDIDDDAIRDEILAHFAAQPVAHGPREVKTLSDIDDTAVAKIHEERYPKDTVIPGILAFYEELDLGPHEHPASRGDLTFVTARPSDALGLIKGHSRETLDKAGFTDLSVMTGSIFDVATKRSMATKKVENVAHYAHMFPEYDLVFVGDSGQGDISAGESVLEAHPDAVRAVFIHDVVALDDERRAELAAKGVWVVDTYTGAARKAHELGLVSADAIARVAQACREALDEIEWESEEQERATREMHARDAAGNAS